MYRVVISPSADADLFGILRYIAYELGNLQAASNFADGVGKCRFGGDASGAFILLRPFASA